MTRLALSLPYMEEEARGNFTFNVRGYKDYKAARHETITKYKQSKANIITKMQGHIVSEFNKIEQKKLANEMKLKQSKT